MGSITLSRALVPSDSALSHASTEYDNVMELTIATRILEARQRMGWEQSDLAQRLRTPVSQQTVSRWEKGGSRPRRELVVELAELFGEDPAEFLEAAGYTNLSDQPQAVARPVRSHLTVLPVWDLAPDKFEELIADLGQALRPDLFVARFGGQGHTQSGVDIVAEKDSRYVLTYQCKRREDFGPKDVREAVSRVTIDADSHFLVLSRRSASPESRKEMQLHPGWTLWDAQDISRAVRGLPLDRSMRLVDTYFPGWREDFLGVPEPGPWLRPDDFFQSSTTGAFYNHDWTLVGRQSEMETLVAFVADPKQHVGLVTGTGGIGKSKVLWEVARQAQAQDVTVRFMRPGAQYKTSDRELLPTETPLLVIIDDAHERDDVKVVMSDILSARPTASILIALRPYFTTLLAADLQQLGARLEDLPQVQLSELNLRDAEALAIEALGPDWPRHLGERIGYLTRDCPFITVLAGTLIRRNLLDPRCVDHEESVRRVILRTFRDVLIADPISGETDLRRSILDALTVLQPFQSGDPTFQRILGRLIERPYDRAISHVRALEGAGVLIRRGEALRVVPDLLADTVLSQASFDEGSHSSTGYLERAWSAAEGTAFQHIFVNAARIDWQVRHDDPQASGLTNTLWDAIEVATHDAGIVGRINAVQLLQKVAYFQPDRSLNLAQWIVENPTDTLEDLEDQPLLRAYPPTYHDVVKELPSVLRAVAYNMAQQRPAMDILWALAATDGRETNRYPEHPIRVLRSLAEFHGAKPLTYNQVVIDVATSWLETDRLEEGGPSPFDVLEPMLATEGSEDSSDGSAIRFTPYLINPEVVLPCRNRILALALKELASPEIWRATRALKAIEASLRLPMGMFGRHVTGDERQKWVPLFVETLDSLRDTLSTMSVDPVIAVAVRQSLHWHLEYSDIGTRDAANAVIGGIPDSIEIRTGTALFDGWGHLSKGRTTDLKLLDSKQEAQRERLAKELVRLYDVDSLVSLVETRLAAQRAAFKGTAGNPRPFAWTLVKDTPAIGLAICHRVQSQPQSPLMDILSVVIAALAEEQPIEAVEALNDLLATEALAYRRAIALALGWNRGRRRLIPGEYDVLVRLTGDEDPLVRQFVAQATQRLAGEHPSEAVALIGQIRFSDSPQVAEELFVSFTGHGSLRWNMLSPDIARQMLRQIVECPSIEEYWIQEFLFRFSGEHPREALELFKHRIERWEQIGYGDYNPLPFHWSHPLQVRADPDLGSLLRELLEWVSQAPDSWMRQEAGGRLIVAVAQDFNDPDVLAFLQETLDERSPTLMAALASVLRQMSHDFVLSHPDFVSGALRAASMVGDESVQHIAGALHGAAVSGSFSGSPGQPFPRDVDQRDKAGRLADSFPSGSVEQEFYRSLQRSAEDRIRWSADRHEKWLDGRDWG